VNKTLEEEELDRELVLKHGPSFKDVVKVKVGKKTLTFFANDGKLHEDYQGRNSRLTLTKRNFHGAPSIEFMVEWNEYEYKRCDQGHNHQSKKIEKKFSWHDLEWEYVEQLIEWLQLGSWTEVNRAEPTEKKLLREARDLLSAIAKESPVFGPAAKKLIAKINDIREPVFDESGSRRRDSRMPEQKLRSKTV
jgi:hypothetical protein